MKRTLALIGGLAIVVSPLGVQAATPGARLWSAKTVGYAAFQDTAPSPDGTKVFVAGTSSSGYTIEAYDSGTGQVAWSKTLGTNPDGGFTHIAVSPDGTKVFVTGNSTGTTTDWDYGTIAYDASNGTKLWFKRYDGAGGPDWPNQIALSPDGAAVVVTGSVATGPDPDHSDFYTDFGTVAYDATTGAKLWSKTYNPLGDLGGQANDAVITAGGEAIVTGETVRSTTSGGNYDAVTIAYDLASGQKVWLKRYDNSAVDLSSALALSPNGGSVYAVGATRVGSDPSAATWAYRTATGAQRWFSTYGGSAIGDSGSEVAVAPNGTVYISGGSNGATAGDFLTIAYEPSAGARLWVKRYNGPASNEESVYAIALSPDGSAVYVTGSSRGSTTSEDWATISYDASSGSVRWTKRFSGSANVYDRPFSIAANPDGSAVFVTGFVNSPDDERGLTVSYAA